MISIIERNNYEIMEQLNDLLRRSGVKKRITLKVIDDENEFGVMVSIPSIFNPDIEPYEVPILENFKENELTLLQTIESINVDIKDLLKTIKPDIVRLTRIKESFDYVPSPFKDLDNTRMINVNVLINEIFDRHQN